MSEYLRDELENFEPRNRQDVARALRQALIYLQCEASDTRRGARPRPQPQPSGVAVGGRVVAAPTRRVRRRRPPSSASPAHTRR